MFAAVGKFRSQSASFNLGLSLVYAPSSHLDRLLYTFCPSLKIVAIETEPISPLEK